MLTFAHSWMIWVLPLPVLVWWLVPPRNDVRAAVRVPFLSRLQTARGTSAQRIAGGRGRRLLRLGVDTAAWLLVLTAMARPQWLEAPIERSIPTRDMLLLVDLSASMDQKDFTNEEGEATDRLTAVKEVLGDFLTRREGDRVGLVVFGNAPFLQVPFTADLNLCRQLLDETEVGMAGPRTALGDAIGLGIQLFENSDVPTKTMIALTDGNDTASNVPPAEAARVAKDREITIHTVAIGDPTTVGEEKLDTESLKVVSQMTGGDFFLALDRSELTGIYDRLDRLETREVKTQSHRPRRDLFYWPLLVALLVSLGDCLIRLLVASSTTKTEVTDVRLRVNARTFELETTEQ